MELLPSDMIITGSVKYCMCGAKQLYIRNEDFGIEQFMVSTDVHTVVKVLYFW